jgi:FecR protein
MPRLAVPVSIPFVLVLCLLAPAFAMAQDPSGDPPAHISIVDGSAVLERDGRNETAPASMPLLAGDRLRTQDGRVEVLFADGSTLHLDTNTLVDFQSDEVIRLLSGRVRLNIAGANRSVAYRVDAPSAWVQIVTPGEYRVAVSGSPAESDVELAVLRGAADLVNEDGRTSIGAGERAFARAGASPSSPYVFNSAAWDAFDRWSETRRESRLGVSAQYLPETVQPYAATFSQHGYWQNVPTYGYVWYPRVRPGWRPYYYGRWTTLRPWGWTWIGSDPWAWPTHHYGRWGFSAGAWFWIPGRTWGPAWVSWAYAPGYVSWCPLGWNNRPVLSFVNVNVYGSRRYHDPWHAWTVVPHRGFGRGDVHINVINASRIDVRTRGSFVVRDAAPDYRGYAVPRSSAPIRTAVSRNGAFGSDAAFRGSPRGGDAGTVQRGDADATAAFRSRRSNGSTLQGRGYPAPARAPQAVPRERSVPSASPSSSREVGSARPTGEPGSYRSRPGGSVTAPRSEPSQAERRAVPRTVPESGVPAVASPQTTGRRAAPESRAAPDAVEASPSSGSNRRLENYPRAVPRSDRQSSPDNNVYAPSRTYGVQRERGVDNAPPPPRHDAPSYRSGGGGEGRSAPSRSEPRMERPSSGPPPQSAAPSRAPEQSSGSSGTASPRSRGDSQSSGRAVPRGRGGRN